MEVENIYYATGRRKTAIARTWLKPGSGMVMINERPLEEYFRIDSTRSLLTQPFAVTNTLGNYDVKARVLGGGYVGQAEAVRHGIARALLQVNPDFRQQLKKAGLIRRDPRAKERKKYGQRGARARFQFSKR